MKSGDNSSIDYNNNDGIETTDTDTNTTETTTTTEACLELRGYRVTNKKGDKREQVFYKELCGKDIFAEINPGVGSCKSVKLSLSNEILFTYLDGAISDLTCSITFK